MADYYPVLKRAIASLPSSSGDARRVVYDKARTALLRQLQSYDPPLSPEDVSEQRMALEECIRRVEGEVAGAAYGLDGPAVAPVPPPAAPVPPPAAKAGPVAPEPAPPPPPLRSEAKPAPKPEPAPEPRAAPPVPPLRPAMSEPVVPPVAAAPKPVPPLRPAQPPPPAPPAAGPDGARPDKVAAGLSALSRTLRQADSLGGASAKAVRTARGAIEDEQPGPVPEEGRIEPGFLDKPLGRKDTQADALVEPAVGPSPETEPTAAPRKAPPRARPSSEHHRGGLRAIAVIAVVLVLGAVAAAVAWTQSDRISALLGGEEPAPAATPPPVETAEAPPADGLEPKILDRLPQEGEEGAVVAPDARQVQTVDVAPPAEIEFPPGAGGAAGEPPADGTEVASIPAEPAPAAEPPPAATQAPAVTPQSPLPGGVPAGTQRAILYEEPIPGTGGARVEGRATWSLVNEPVLPGEPPVPQLRAVVEVPDRGMTMTMSIRENADPALPASHVAEVRFDLPEDFSGRTIETTPGLILKETEDARGDPLVGAVAKVADNLFWLALSGTEPDSGKNVTLLDEREWIDVPIRYGNRRRAILTFEKGPAGNSVVDQALSTWAQ